MNKIDLEVKIESLRTMVQESQQSASNYTGQLVEMEKRLADINKPALTPSQFDDITEAVEGAIGEFDFTDTENFEIEYSIDYDNRVNCESHDFRNHEGLVEMVCNKLYELFAETEDEFDRTEVDNHKPVE
tara:strand:- start:348 stop:737 length:390 start_codon:yes stop_codon:yes gene_type:complete